MNDDVKCVNCEKVWGVTTYVLGFLFNETLDKVALIRKVKPEWQAGKLNGIGGKVESGEAIGAAMSREFYEETGVNVIPSDWQHYCDLSGDFCVHCFAAVGYPSLCRTIEEEVVSVVDVSSIMGDTIESLTWLIHLAIDFLTDGRPAFTTVRYHKHGGGE